VDVVLLHEAFDKRLLEHAQVGRAELEELRRLLAGDEERGLWVLVLERLALVHRPLCASIFGFSVREISLAILTSRLTRGYSHLSQHVCGVCERVAKPKSWRAGNFFRASASAPAGSGPSDKGFNSAVEGQSTSEGRLVD
jgi:hypothetical protein